MSAPKDIKDFNTQVKRTSDRINGNSASMSGANPAALTQGETGSSPAPPAVGAGTGGGPTVHEPAGGNLDNGQPLPGKEMSNAAVPSGKSGTRVASSTNSSGVSTIPATATVPRLPVNPAQGVLAPLIAEEVINKTVVNGTSLPSVSSAAAHSKFMAGTSTILNRIDECSPDAIKTWLQSRGFDLVALTPGGTSKEVAELTPNAQNTPASHEQNTSSKAADEPLTAGMADTSLAGRNVAAATLSESAGETPGPAAIPAKRPPTTQLGPFDLTVDEDDKIVALAAWWEINPLTDRRHALTASQIITLTTTCRCTTAQEVLRLITLKIGDRRSEVTIPEAVEGAGTVETMVRGQGALVVAGRIGEEIVMTVGVMREIMLDLQGGKCMSTVEYEIFLVPVEF
ncbi:uncharacterized protein MELLADRAFT_113402 [Melampsora larici-populina 98AG31]|uniref:Uncharacterized protein n=1 Tax=Melampsora larici-populina (strain 98AG31 / pathotype 3-4-7) TaxID=747676 RepID=F4S9R4_MELLP|nr:uncharacterized protein MELLADRAFT_113402 [Melampsora larici-populina 98AG31]EGF98621.1 hypothetical protein MELLADRAFT_113402 [Melampsora larici-populina 98AG31]